MTGIRSNLIRDIAPVAAISREPHIMVRRAYVVTPILTDGSSGPPLNLRGLFEQFVDETGR